MGGLFDIDNIGVKIAELEEKINKDDFWDNFEYANKINKEYSNLKKIKDNYTRLIDNIETLDLLKQELNEKEYLQEFQKLEEEIKALEEYSEPFSQQDLSNDRLGI